MNRRGFIKLVPPLILVPSMSWAHRTIIKGVNPAVKVPAASGPTQVASDDFNRSNGALGSNWTSPGYAPVISSNAVIPGNSDWENEAYWSGTGSFNADQYGQVTLTAVSEAICGVLCRGSSSGGYVCWVYHGTTWGFATMDSSGNTTNIGTEQTKTIANGTVLRFKVSGTTLSASFDGGSTYEAYTYTSSAFSSGTPGLYVTQAGSIVDNWSGGNL